MLVINENLRLIGKDLNFVLEAKNDNRERLKTDEDIEPVIKWQTAGYFTTFSAIKKYLEKKDNYSGSEITEFISLIDNVNEIIESFSKIELQEENNIKVIVNENWYIVGSEMFYRVIKKEQIKQHRFTKEENVGKDKFINSGFAPNIAVALKLILNESILDLLSSNEEITLNDIALLSKEVQEDSQSLIVEKISVEDAVKFDDNDDEQVCKDEDEDEDEQ